MFIFNLDDQPLKLSLQNSFHRMVVKFFLNYNSIDTFIYIQLQKQNLKLIQMLSIKKLIPICKLLNQPISKLLVK